MKKLNNEFVKSKFEKEGYEFLELFKDTRTKIKFKYPEEHIYSMTWHSWVRGGLL